MTPRPRNYLSPPQGKDKPSIDSVIRRWFDSGVFRAVHDPRTAQLIERPASGGLSFDDFRVLVLLNEELNGGDFDEDRLSSWLRAVLDASGDGSISTEEFLEELHRAPQMTPPQKDLLGQFLEFCDLSKFARHEPTEEDCRRLHAMAIKLVKETAPPLPGALPPRVTPPQLTT